MSNSTTTLDAALAPLRDRLQRGDADWMSLLWQRSGALSPPPALDALVEPDRLLHDLLFRAQPVDAAAASTHFGEPAIAALLEAEVVRRDGDALVSTGLRMRNHGGLSLLTGEAKSPDGEVEFTLHFGTDSMAFGELILHQRPVAKAADLCCGSGILALCLSRIARQVVGVELIPQTAAVARANVALAGKSAQVEIRQGDLFAPLADERFDLIVCNPPFVPGVEDPERDPVGAAGADGLDVVRAVLEGAPAHLEPEGRLMMMTGFLGDRDAPFASGELENLSARHGWRLDLLALLAPMPMEQVRFTPVMDEDVAKRVGQIRAAAKAFGASHYHVGLIVGTMAGVPSGLARHALHPVEAERLRCAVHALRQSRSRQ